MFGVRVAIALSAALAIAPSSVRAEALVRGSPAAVSIDAQNTSVEEILAALSAAFGVHYRSSANLEKRLNGTYEGSLPRVVARILEGYNFFVRTSEGTIEITVLGTGTTRIGGAGATFKAAERRADAAAAAQTSPVVATIKIAEGPTPPIPLPAPSASGSAPTLVPGSGPAAAPLAAPPAPAPGSTPGPIPQAVPSADVPMPAPTLTPTSVPAPSPSAVLPAPAAGTAPSPLPRAP
jgi:hypothetical protein